MAVRKKKKEEDYSKLEDRLLIKIAMEGDQKAFTFLMNRYMEPLRRYLNGLLFPGNMDTSKEMAEEPQDIAQETFHKAFLRIKKYDSNFEFSTWLFTIAKNTAKDYKRKNKIDIDESVSKGVTSGTSSVGSPQKSPEDAMISNQQYDKIISLIDHLPGRYKEIARMRFIKEYAYDEIARESGLPINTVKTRINRARKLLAEMNMK
ncbi:MAG: sigma-70 family RNA polymerase sigma factor [Bacteroidales bacterium]|jgi:RNA polymerase sigma-70 factor (ECF subfamily)|nr:sigma-70 family RNA polymerase sigma factor [Bacteroidales bacterium]